MANGDDALAAGMEILSGNEDRREGYDEINKTRDYIASFFATVRTWAEGLFLPKADVYDGTGSVFGKVPRYDSVGRLITASPSANNQATPKSYVDNAIASIPAPPAPVQQFNDDGTTYSVTGRHLRASGNILSTTGTFYAGGATAATDGYTIAYLNSDGRLAKGASSERYKKHISSIDPTSLGDIWPALVRYQMRSGDGSWKYGYIAERLAESEDLAPFVVYADLGTGPIPDSIDFIALLMAQNAQLKQQLDQQEQRLNALEAGHADS